MQHAGPNIVALMLAVAMGFSGNVFSETVGYINVRDHGAKGDGRTDDTQAIQAALTLASKGFVGGRRSGTGCYYKANMALLFPLGRYRITDTLVGSADLLGRESAIIEMDGYDKNIFENRTHAWRQRIANLTFLGGNDHLVLANENIDTGKLVIENCEFYYSRGVAVKILKGTYSTQVTIRDCVFIECDQVFINWSDWSRITDCWITTSKAMKDKAVGFVDGCEKRKGL
jgi:hypothetical protein